ncbi:MAG: indolepyruvate ferredoxin oxidoreductase subunit alpha [Lachnospiraceae bacterium]|nr:indolepyruvate ferredoxin oxidoreductase subunit alpha [Lachnospiraceae bacterium]
MKVLMTGNEALARGAYEAGCHIATGYPGTPSTEILENLAKYKEVLSQWAPNEKVAAEVAAGVSATGGRVIVTMKVVGLNVAMDPLMTMSYLGTRGGLVFVVADDPGCSSSQTEQDNRLIAKFAKIPLIEPSDSQECKDFMKDAFEISEKFDVPVMVRMTTRTCHSKSLVELGERTEVEVTPYVRTRKYCSSPAAARVNHAKLEKMLPELEEYSNTSRLNRIEWGDKKIGIITAGASYQHAKAAFGDSASYLKIGLSNKLPMKLIKEFASQVEKLYVIEENEPMMEDQIRLAGFECTGRDRLTPLYDLTPQILKESLLDEKKAPAYTVEAALPPRPPVLCAGCPHRSIFYAVSKHKKAVAANDIGCYTLGFVPPLDVTDTIVCMGAGITAGLGMERLFRRTGQDKKVFGFIGDSTFFHSGITGLLDAVWNGSNMAICILDNRTTAMTGHQENPGTGHTLMGEEAPMIDIRKLVLGLGVPEDHIREVNAYDMTEVQQAVDDAAKAEGVFVIINKQPCALLKSNMKARAGMRCFVDQEKCKKCKACMKIGCPAVISKDNRVSIDETQCNGCTLCLQQCPFNAIRKEGFEK